MFLPQMKQKHFFNYNFYFNQGFFLQQKPHLNVFTLLKTNTLNTSKITFFHLSIYISIMSSLSSLYSGFIEIGFPLAPISEPVFSKKDSGVIIEPDAVYKDMSVMSILVLSSIAFPVSIDGIFESGTSSLDSFSGCSCVTLFSPDGTSPNGTPLYDISITSGKSDVGAIGLSLGSCTKPFGICTISLRLNVSLIKRCSWLKFIW